MTGTEYIIENFIKELSYTEAFGDKIAVCLAQDNNGMLQEVTSLISKNATEIWLYPEPKWGDGYAAWMPLPEPYKAEGSDEE